MSLIEYFETNVRPSRQTHHLMVPLNDDLLPPAVWFDVAETGMCLFFVVTPAREGIHVEVRAFADGEPALLWDCITNVDNGVVDFFLRPERTLP